MRVIHRASLVFLLRDIYSKTPVNTAVILCNGKQNPYTHKDDGYYVFSNLYPGNYDISISCIGYNDLNFSVELKENETKEMQFNLSYSPNNKMIMSMTRFDIKCVRNGKTLVDTPVSIKLKNELNFIKLIEPIKADSDESKLNIEMIPGLIGQEYIYEAKGREYRIALWSYDQEKKCYILKEFPEKEVPAEGKFYAVWDVRTDKNGHALLPLMSQFMKEDILNFEISSYCEPKGIVSEVTFDITGKRKLSEAIFAEADFVDMPEKPPPIEEEETDEESNKDEDSEETTDEEENEDIDESEESADDEELDEPEESSDEKILEDEDLDESEETSDEENLDEEKLDKSNETSDEETTDDGDLDKSEKDSEKISDDEKLDL